MEEIGDFWKLQEPLGGTVTTARRHTRVAGLCVLMN